MLFAGLGSVRIVKNCDRGLENFQARGHSFSLYGPTLSRQITYLFIHLFLAINWLTSGLTQLCHRIGRAFMLSISTNHRKN